MLFQSGLENFEDYYLPNLNADVGPLTVTDTNGSAVLEIRKMRGWNLMIIDTEGRELYKVKESVESSVMIIHVESKTILENVRVRGFFKKSFASKNFEFSKHIIYIRMRSRKEVGLELSCLQKLSLSEEFEDKALLVAFYYASKLQEILNEDLTNSFMSDLSDRWSRAN